MILSNLAKVLKEVVKAMVEGTIKVASAVGDVVHPFVESANLMEVTATDAE